MEFPSCFTQRYIDIEGVIKRDRKRGEKERDRKEMLTGRESSAEIERLISQSWDGWDNWLFHLA